jgi:hypothetical protein
MWVMISPYRGRTEVGVKGIAIYPHPARRRLADLSLKGRGVQPDTH